jgi:hypothetical protein
VEVQFRVNLSSSLISVNGLSSFTFTNTTITQVCVIVFDIYIYI